MDPKKFILPATLEVAALLAEGALQIGDWHNRPLAIAILVFCVVILVWGAVRAFDESDSFWFGKGAPFHDAVKWVHERSARIFQIGLALSLATWVLCAVLHIGASSPAQPIVVTVPAQAIPEPPRIVVKQAAPIWATKNDMRVNLVFENDGPRAVRNPVPHFGVAAASGNLTKEAEDKMFVELRTLTGPSKDSGDLLEPGDSRTSTFPSTLNEHLALNEKTLKEAEDKHYSLYFIFEIRYFDVGNDRKHEKLWHTEYCEYWDFNIPKELIPRTLPHICHGHNGVSEIKL